MEITRKEQLKNRTVICKAIANFDLFDNKKIPGLCAYGRNLRNAEIFSAEDLEIFIDLVHKHIHTKPIFSFLCIFHDYRSISKSKSINCCYFWNAYDKEPRLNYLHYILEQYL